jgi:hypothetical protein
MKPTSQLAWILAALAALAAGGVAKLRGSKAQDAPPAAPSGDPKAVAPASPPADAARTARLAAQRAVAEAEIAAIDKFGQEPRFLATMRAVVDQTPAEEEEGAPFRPVRIGKVALATFGSFVRWQSPRAGREKPVALDLDLPHHPYAAIVDFDRQLRERGLDLLVVLMPSRLQIYPELVTDMPASPGFAGTGIETQRFLLALNDAGVEAIGLTGPFAAERFGAERPSDQLYLRTDPHWTARGAELAARVVAKEIARYPWFEPGPMKEGRDFHAEERDFAYVPNEALTKRGAEKEAMTGRCLMRGDAPDQLLDAMDPAGPIIVLGDSYVRVHSMTACDFCSQLFRFTGWKIDVIQTYGGAAEQVRRKLARRDPTQMQGKKLIVWVIPETILPPNDWWKLVKLAPK